VILKTGQNLWCAELILTPGINQVKNVFRRGAWDAKPRHKVH